MKRTIFYILAALLLMVTLSACGMLQPKATDSPKHKALAPTESPSLSKQEQAEVKHQAHQLLSRQDYVGTIKLIQEETHKGTGETVLSKEYLLAANATLNQASTLMQQGLYPKAALLLKTVKDSYPKSLTLQKQVTASPAQITERINLCTKKLMEEGLVAYRSGELTTAIDIWQQVLEFDPQHQGAQSSIQTTQLQLDNLKVKGIGF